MQKVTGQILPMFSTPAYYSLSNPSPVIYYIAVSWGSTGDFAKAFAVNNGALSGTPVSVGTYRFSKPGSTPQISANGGSNAHCLGARPWCELAPGFECREPRDDVLQQWNRSECATERDAFPERSRHPWLPLGTCM